MPQLTFEAPVTIQEGRQNLAESGIDLSKPGFRTAGWLIAARAEEYGMPITQADITHWVVTQGVLRGLDDIIDNEHEMDISGAVDLASEGQAVDGHVTAAEAQVFSDLLGVYDDGRREHQLSVLKSWPQFEIAKRTAEGLDKYIDGIGDEAEAYVSLITTIDPESEDDAGQVRARVNQWTNNLIRAGYFSDYARDLGKDYKNGRSPVPPTLETRLALARLTFSEGGTDVLRDTPLRLLPKIGSLIIHYAVQ